MKHSDNTRERKKSAVKLPLLQLKSSHRKVIIIIVCSLLQQCFNSLKRRRRRRSVSRQSGHQQTTKQALPSVQLTESREPQTTQSQLIIIIIIITVRQPLCPLPLLVQPTLCKRVGGCAELVCVCVHSSEHSHSFKSLSAAQSNLVRFLLLMNFEEGELLFFYLCAVQAPN